jgi:UDP-N-acetylmuramate--alanine ligase
MDLAKIKKIYMIGIKGVGMTMLAQFFAKNGVEVTGSDTAEKFMTDESLKNSGIRVIEGFDERNIPADADLIVYSTAYNAHRNIEVSKALNLPVKIMTYSEALTEVFNQKYGIAVVGCHGKTTTTAWLGYVLQKSGISPNVMVGSKVPQFGGNTIVGKSDYLVVEADEYQNKFKNFKPKGVIFNNVEYDHPDFFPNMESYVEVFIELIKKIPKKGFLIANYDDQNIRKISKVNCSGKVISYSIDNLANFMAYDISQAGDGQYFKVKMNYQEEESLDSPMKSDEVWAPLGDFKVKLSGRHNIYNALAVIATSIELDMELSDIRKYLEEFSGASRRAEIMGEYHGSIIIDDYAHHPTEIKTTISGIKERYGNKKLRVIFHPHSFTRTKALLRDFSRSFMLADEVVVLDIYGSAREQQGEVHSLDLVKMISEWNKTSGNAQSVVYIATLEECREFLKDTIGRGEIVLLMGAGDVFRVGEMLLNEK